MGDKLMAYVIASFSGGKDSTAMVLHMIELGEQLDEVITCDTGMEFPAMYEHIEKVRAIIESAGIKYTTLKADRSFEDMLLNSPPTDKRDVLGYGWPGVRIRWCTKFLKTELMRKYTAEHPDAIQCVGLALDEQARRERENNKNQRHPLAEWGWTEADALAYCKARGFDWGGLYDRFKRVSCWICPLQPVSELRKVWQYYPELWARLEEYDRVLTDGQHNDREYNRHRVAYYTRRFEKEARAQKEQTALDKFMEDA